MRRLLRRMWARKLGRLVIIGGALFAAMNVAGLFVSSQSWFCNTCHSMGTYYESWQVSKHSDVECTQCHIPPGMGNFLHAKLNGMGQLVDTVLSREGSKPSATVGLFACSRSGCHELQEVRETNKEEGSYLFQHGKHLDLVFQGIKVDCSTCHSHVSGEEHFTVNTNTCVACHLPTGLQSAPALGEILARDNEPAASQGEKEQVTSAPAAKIATRECRKCHEPPSEPVQYQGMEVVHADYLAYGAACESCHHAVTEPAPKVENDKCYTCHDFGMAVAVDVAELHDQHSNGTHKVECFSCHGMIRHGKDAQEARLSRFDCDSCHLNQHDVQLSTYRLTRSEWPAMPTTQPTTQPHPVLQGQATQPAYDLAATPMFLAHVDCTGCHTQPRAVSSKPLGSALVNAATPEACDRCHKPDFGEQMIPQWQRNTKELHESVSLALTAVIGLNSEQAAAPLAEAMQLLEMVRLDGSWGVHNPPYTERLLQVAAAKVAEARELATPQTAEQAEGTE